MMGYMYVWEHSRESHHVDVDCSSIFEGLHSLKLDFRITM